MKENAINPRPFMHAKFGEFPPLGQKVIAVQNEEENSEKTSMLHSLWLFPNPQRSNVSLFCLFLNNNNYSKFKKLSHVKVFFPKQGKK